MYNYHWVNPIQVQVISRRSFVKLPYDLLYSTIECPFLTVDRFVLIFQRFSIIKSLCFHLDAKI
jgi:hypothetical protein